MAAILPYKIGTTNLLGWVQTVFCCDLLSNCSLKAKVKASQRLTDTPHEAWVCIEKKTLNVITGHCTCMAG